MNTPTALPATTRLAVDRTRLAYERTLMAWVRTAASLITFGFTFYKYFHGREEQLRHGQISPRGFALLLIGMGLGGLVIATIEHRVSMQALRVEYGEVRYSLAAVVALLVGGLGIVGFSAVLFRL